MTGLELAAAEIGQDWRIRLAAAEDRLALINQEMAVYLEGVDRLYALCDQVKAMGCDR